MKFRLPAIIALLGVALLVACDSGSSGSNSSQSTPTTGTGANIVPTATIAQAAPTKAPAAQPTNSTAAAAQPTATEQAQATNAAAPQEPLTLQPVTLETNDTTRVGVLASEHKLNLPAGFRIKVYAAGIGGVRWLGLSPDGTLYATSPSAGKVFTLPDKDGDGVADKKDVLASDLPPGGQHSTRTLAFSPDGTKLFVSAGSSCNVCVESDPKRAAISLYSPDGKFQKVYAKGLRNAVGLLFQPGTGDLWATNNGRDNLGDDIPPETIYDVKEGANYGWPYCYDARTPDKTQNPPAGYCEKTDVPAVEMQAHSAPLGLAFYDGKQFPQEFQGDLFVAFHGSWNRSVPTGYKLVLVHFKNNQPDKSMGDKMVEDFGTGWQEDGVWGRPVDPLVAPDGSLFLTDDKANAIYRISYEPNAGP